MIKRVNAGITSKSKLYKRLFDGEIFYTLSGSKVHYDEMYIIKGKTPFRFNDTYLAGIAMFYSELLIQREVEWYDDITDSVLCWVSDDIPSAREYSSLITAYCKEMRAPFQSRGHNWIYATPVTPDDLLQ